MNYKNIEPTNRKLLVKVPDPPKESKSGIILKEDEVEERVTRGTVLKVASDVNEIQKGNEVLFTKYGHSEILFKEDPSDKKEKGERLHIVFMDDVLAIIKK